MDPHMGISILGSHRGKSYSYYPVYGNPYGDPHGDSHRNPVGMGWEWEWKFHPTATLGCMHQHPSEKYPIY